MKDLFRNKFLSAIVVLISFSVVGCAHDKVIIKKSVEQSYINAHGEGAKDAGRQIKKELTIRQSYGYVKPYVPVVEPPEIKKVWIPDHTGEGNILIGGHWIYIVIKKATWYIKDKSSPGKKIPVIVPYKEGKNAFEEK